MYSLGGESGSSLDTTAVGKGGDFGVAQWVGSRRAGLGNPSGRVQNGNGANAKSHAPEMELTYESLEVGGGPYSRTSCREFAGATAAINAKAEMFETWRKCRSPLVNNSEARYA